MLEGALDYSLLENSQLLIHRYKHILHDKSPNYDALINYLSRQVADKWKNQDGVEEMFYGEVVSFNKKAKMYLANFTTGDKEPVQWEYSPAELVKVVLD